MCGRPAGVDPTALRNSLVIEVCNLLTQVVVLKKSRAALAGSE